MSTSFSFPFPFFHTYPCFRLRFYSSSFFVLFSFLLFGYSLFVTSHNANDTNAGPAVTSSGVEETAQFLDMISASGTRVSDIEVDCEVHSGSVAEQKS